MTFTVYQNYNCPVMTTPNAHEAHEAALAADGLNTFVLAKTVYGRGYVCWTRETEPTSWLAVLDVA